jgi:phosphohistidine phosphatase
VARTLWLLRHGDAEPEGAGGDADRRLTAHGEQQARAAGRALERLGVSIEQAFTSPRVRASDTARLACAALRIEPVVHAPLAGGFDARDADELLASSAPGASLLLVGHEPDLSHLAGSLTGARIEMGKGAIAAIAGGTLVALLRPREIQLIAGL